MSKLAQVTPITSLTLAMFCAILNIEVQISTNKYGWGMYQRKLADTLARFTKFPVVAVLGPRQSGKTTLVRDVFKNHSYLNLEDPATLMFITKDPRGFLHEYENKHGIIIDEFQHAPEFLSYIQLEVDEKKRPGYFVLTGSQNFLMNQAITQSLAGRAGILTLLPLSLSELKNNDLLSERVNEIIFNGFYPRLYDQHFEPRELYPSYIHSYIERDIRQIINVEDLRIFQKFISLCAGRIGQLLNVTELAMNCGAFIA
jgi:predicted AAA+ superfamily ATPase